MYIKASTFNALEALCGNVYILLSKSLARYANKSRTVMMMLMVMIMMMMIMMMMMMMIPVNML